MLILEDLKLENIAYQKDKIKNNNIINRISFFNQPIVSDKKRYEEIRKLTTGQGEDYTTSCLSNYYFNKSNYRLLSVDLSRQKKLDSDSKTIKQIEFVGQIEI